MYLAIAIAVESYVKACWLAKASSYILGLIKLRPEAICQIQIATAVTWFLKLFTLNYSRNITALSRTAGYKALVVFILVFVH